MTEFNSNDLINYSLINKILSLLKFNDPIIESLVSYIFLGFIAFFVKKDFNISQIFSIFYNFYKKNDKKKKSVIEFSINVESYASNYNTNLIPIEYKAILFRLSKNKTNTNKITLSSKKQRYSYWDDEEVSNKNTGRCIDFDFLITHEEIIKLEDNVFIENTITKNNLIKQNKNDVYYDLHNIEIFSDKYSVNELRERLQEMIEDYKKNMLMNKINGLLHISVNKSNDKENNDLEYSINKLQTKKSFDNIFFEQKNQLKNRLDNFNNNKNIYEKMGVPHNLGLLFHGFPGCGKTSCIKAIANYLNRHIFEINLSNIKNTNQLKEIFYNEIIDDYFIPIDKRIMIFEDIDCMSDVIKERKDDDLKNVKKKNKKNKNTNDDENYNEDKNSDDENIDDNKNNNDIKSLLLNQFINSKNYTTIDFNRDSDSFTLSFLLNIIDGTLEQNDRIIIMSTNYPEKIDKALTRTGRIDMKINFKKCTSKIANEIIKKFYDKEDHTFIDIKEYYYSPSDIIEICMNNDYENSIKKLLISNNNDI